MQEERTIEMKNTLALSEFQENFVSNFNQGSRNTLSDLKSYFLVLCYDDGLSQMRGLESYFNDFVHILIVVRESGLNFQISEEKNKGVF